MKLTNKETKMTNLSDFLKCEKVRCVRSDVFDLDLTDGEEYEITDARIEVKADDGEKWLYPWSYFEPVLETAIEATNALDDTPTRTVNEFEVGDRVYIFGRPYVSKVRELYNSVIKVDKSAVGYKYEHVTLATPENYEMLCKLYPYIDFEKPPITGNELALAMLEKDDDLVFMADCFGMNGERMGMRVVTGFDGYNFCTDDGMSFRNVVPVGKYGTPLTSEVLDD